MFIREKPGSFFYYVIENRGFDDQELMLSDDETAQLQTFLADVVIVQAYLQRSYELTRQGAYEAAKQLEVPECLKEKQDERTADQPEEVSVAKQRKPKGTAAASSSTSPKAQKQQESSSSTNQQTE